MFAALKKKWLALGAALIVLIAAGGVACWQRTPLLAWYAVRGLAAADESQRPRWVEKVRRLDRAAWPRLVECLCQSDERCVANAAAALASISKPWPADDARWTELGSLLTDRFAHMTVLGQEAALRLECDWLRAERGGAAARDGAGRLLRAAVRVAEKSVRARALELAVLLPAQAGQPELLNVERELARQHLRDGETANRVCAVQLAMLPGVDLKKEIVPLLEDGAPEVRRAAMLAIGHLYGDQQPEVIATEDLLRWLHDTDDDVRRICEAALRGRGLQDEHLRIGRLVTDTRATVRLQVLDSIRSNPDLEPGIWLRTLTHDPAPEVRIAAVRAAAEYGTVDLSDRIDQMARSDPSPTVCQLARYYLNYPKSRTNRMLQP
jgi:hypothetical protein